jgi:hypothetical protein
MVQMLHIFVVLTAGIPRNIGITYLFISKSTGQRVGPQFTFTE